MAGTQDKTVLPTLKPGITTATPATGVDNGADIRNTTAEFFNKTFDTLRRSGKVLEAIRALARTHGDASMAVSSMVRIAHTPLRYSVYDRDHQLSAEGSQLLRSIHSRMDYAYDYSDGFDDRMALENVESAMLRSVVLAGAASSELVLDKARLPYRIQPVSVETLKFSVAGSKVTGGKKVVPKQKATGGGQDINLNIATFFYASLDQDLTSAYSNSPMEPAINSAMFHNETVDDIRRVVKRSGHSRLVVKLLVEKIIASAPIELQHEPEKLAKWVEDVRETVKTEIESLSPEAALVFYDSMEAEYLNSEIGASADYKPLMETIDSILSTALKTPLSVLGKRASSGSQNVASTESLIYLKVARGLHLPVEVVLSRVMTLAVRLFGFDGYVKAKFDPIDLRPDIELEAFHAMRQARILEQLSLGFISDAEAAELLRTGPRDPAAPALSGTMFASGTTPAAPSPNSDPARTALTPSTPNSAGGKDNSRK